MISVLELILRFLVLVLLSFEFSLFFSKRLGKLLHKAWGWKLSDFDGRKTSPAQAISLSSTNTNTNARAVKIFSGVRVPPSHGYPSWPK